MLTALGGPLGAIITTWFSCYSLAGFGDNAETAAEKAINASQRIKTD